jgi:sugar lactone lactonase YvrE
VSQANPRSHTAQPASDQQFLLAEGPLWDAAASRVLWVDIRAGLVLEGRAAGDRVDVVTSHRLPGTVGAVVPAADGSLLLAAADGFALVTTGGEVLHGPRVLPEGVDSRFNDAAVDPAGRLLAGSMAEDGRRGGERLYRLDPDGSVHVVDDGYTLSNGLAWTAAGTTLYHAESVPGVVHRRRYDPATGDVGPREDWLTSFPGGVPDGLCMDADDNLWIAVHGAGEVRGFTPAGEQFATVHVDAPHTTKPGFVGAALDRMLITTARDELSAEQVERFPLSGRLFLADVGATGRPAPPWAGDAATFAASLA